MKKKTEIDVKIIIILISVLIVSTISIVLIGNSYYGKLRNNQLNDIKNEFASITKEKEKLLLIWRNDRANEVMNVFNTPFFISSLEDYKKNPTQNKLSAINAWMNEYRSFNSEIIAMTIIDRQRKVKFWSGPESETFGQFANRAIDSSLANKSFYISDLQKTTKSYIHFILTFPLNNGDNNNGISGFAIVRLSPTKRFADFITKWATNYPSGEIYLVSKQATGYVYLNNLKFKKNALLEKITTCSDKNCLNNHITGGAKGLKMGCDYRNKDVTAYIKDINGTYWTLVAKIDNEDILKSLPVSYYNLVIWEIVLISLIAMVLFVFWSFFQTKYYRKILLLNAEKFELNEKYKQLTLLANDAIILTDIDRNIIDANEKATVIFGYSRDELLKLRLDDLRLDPEPEKIKESFNKLMIEGSLVFETFDRRKDGSPFPVEVSSKKIETDKINFLLIKRDISERKKAETELTNREKKYRTILNTASDAILLSDAKTGIIIDCNYYAESLLKRPINDIIGKSLTSFLSSVYFDFMLSLKSKPESKLLQNYDFEINLPDNKTVPVDISSSVFELDGDEYILSIIRDITERKKIEIDLIQARLKAEESDYLKSAFLANMSHEIRTPMNAILGFSQLLDSDDLSPEERNNFVNIINKRGKDLLSLINDILDISKIEAQQLVLHYSSGDIKVLLYEIYDMFSVNQFLPGNKPIDLKITSIPDLKDFVMTDFERVKQILINLIGNAFKFTSEGTIEFGCQLNEQSLVFYVKDTGIGIPEDKLLTIFERFRQVDENRLTGKFGGTGLGLSISKGLINLLEGRIWVESTADKGSAFYFSVPYIPADSASEVVKSFKKDYNWENKNILIVDDDELNVELILMFLRHTKVNCIIKTDGKSALDYVRANNTADIILMDIQLPDIDGFTLTKELLKLKPGTIIIAQTAYVFSEDKEKCLAAGCSDFIAKPLEKDSLLTTIEKYI